MSWWTQVTDNITSQFGSLGPHSVKGHTINALDLTGRKVITTPLLNSVVTAQR